jgi:hypothetical protein
MILKDESEGVWMKAIMIYFNELTPAFIWRDLGKPRETCQYSLFSGLVSNVGPHEYEAGVPTTEPQYHVLFEGPLPSNLPLAKESAYAHMCI